MKKRLLLMLVLALLLTFGATSATVDSGECGDNLTWTLDGDGTLTISGNGAMDDYQRNAPWNNSAIKTIKIESGVKTIGSYAFYYCNKLKKVEIPNTVYSIGNDAFANCQNLTEINIPSSILRIDNDSIYRNPFNNCKSLTNISVDSKNKYYASINGVLYNKEKTKLILCPEGIKEYEIPMGVSQIENNAFQNCSNLERLKMSDSVIEIGYWAFDDCVNLRELTLSENITSLDLGTFKNCTNLIVINVPNKVNEIGTSIFENCKNLETIYLPENLKKIGENAFKNCVNLKKIVYAGSETQWDSIYIANSNAELDNVDKVFLKTDPEDPDDPNKPTDPEDPDEPNKPTDPEDPDEPNKPTDPEQPDKPTNPDKPTDPEKPDTLPITSRPGGLGSRLTVRVEGGHWLTVQVHRAGTIVLSSIQAPGTGMVTLTFSAAAGSVVQVWETENEMTFTNGVLNNKILATNVKNV